MNTKPKRSKINCCATTSCGSVSNLKPQFTTGGKLYFLCRACSFILQKLEESAVKARTRSRAKKVEA